MGVSIAPDTFRVMLQEAFSRGFTVAAVTAGILGLVAAIMLAVMIFRKRRDRVVA